MRSGIQWDRAGRFRSAWARRGMDRDRVTAIKCGVVGGALLGRRARGGGTMRIRCGKRGHRCLSLTAVATRRLAPGCGGEGGEAGRTRCARARDRSPATPEWRGPRCGLAQSWSVSTDGKRGETDGLGRPRPAMRWGRRPRSIPRADRTDSGEAVRRVGPGAGAAAFESIARGAPPAERIAGQGLVGRPDGHEHDLSPRAQLARPRGMSMRAGTSGWGVVGRRFGNGGRGAHGDLLR